MKDRMTATREQMLEIAWRAALAAGDAILGVYSTAFDVQQKSDKTPVTEPTAPRSGLSVRC
jgi:3'-phosphoadenosine 5'-phosphosulfate (PAPS) 3'-phosphatase